MTQQEAKFALWKGGVAHARAEFGTSRAYKVGMCVMIFSEVEVVAESPADAERRGLADIDRATVVMKTAPISQRLMIQRRSDPKNPESALEWCEIEHGPLDIFDANSPRVWQVKR